MTSSKRALMPDAVEAIISGHALVKSRPDSDQSMLCWVRNRSEAIVTVGTDPWMSQRCQFRRFKVSVAIDCWLPHSPRFRIP